MHCAHIILTALPDIIILACRSDANDALLVRNQLAKHDFSALHCLTQLAIQH